MNGATVSRRVSITPWPGRCGHLAVAGGQPSLPESPASPSACPRLRPPRPRRPRPPSPSATTGSSSTSTRGAWTLATTSSGSVSSVASDGISRSRTWIAASKSTRLSIEYSIDCGRWSGRALTRTDSEAVEQRAALVDDRDDVPVEHERDVDGELLGHPHEEQVDVERPPRHRVDLDTVDQHRLGLLAVDGQVDEGVGAGMATKLLEVVAVDETLVDSRPRPNTTAGRRAVAAQRGDLLADEFARLGGEGGTRGRGGGHGSCWNLRCGRVAESGDAEGRAR